DCRNQKFEPQVRQRRRACGLRIDIALALARLLPNFEWQDGKEHDPPADKIDRKREGNTHNSRLNLLDFNEGSAEILGVKKQNWLAVRTDFGLAGAEHASALGQQLIAGREYVFHLIADVMDAAIGIALKEFGNWRGFSERLKQLDFRIWQGYENGGDA